MAALLVAIAVMTVMMTMALPVWNTAAQREREAELVFRGEQYAHAIALYQRKYANALPPSLDVLINERFLRKKYLDPVTRSDFQPMTGAAGQAALGVPGGAGQQGRGQQTGPGAAGGGARGLPTPGGGTPTPGGGALGGFGGGLPGGIMGVTSKSTAKSLRLYNGRGVYNEWAFVPVQRSQQAGAGAPGSATPGGRGQQTPGGPGGRATPGGGPGGGFRPPGSGGFGRPSSPPGRGFGR